MADIGELQVQSLFIGGRDGGKVHTTVSSGIVHMIEVLTDDTEFTEFEGEDQNGDARDWLTDNGYSSVLWKAGTLHFAPFGGIITDFIADKVVRYYRLPATDRTQNDG